MSEKNVTVSRSNPVLIMTAVLAGYSAFTGGLLALDIVPAKVVGLLILLGTAVSLGWGVYTRSITTPTSDVVAKATRSGLVVAGPASLATTGSEVVVSEPETGEVVAPPVNEA